MLRYTIKRLLMIIPIMLGIALVVMIFIDLTPGDPARMVLGDHASEEDLAAFREEMGLDDPFIVRYVRFVGNVVRGDFGNSFATGRPVFDEMMQRFPFTLLLVTLSMLLSIMIGIPIGIYAAVNQYSWKDNASIFASLFCVSMPSFWFALILVQLFSVRLGLLPAAGIMTWQGWILPVISLALGFSAVIARQMRSNMLEVIRQDYITTARAKGQTERKVLYRHALKNALIPVIMIVGAIFGLSLGGMLIAEVIFSIPGLGTYTLAGLQGRDYAVIKGSVFILSTLFAVIILIIDLVFAIVDPRIRSQFAGKKALIRKKKISEEGAQ